MGSIGAFLALAAGPLAKRVIQALGFGVITFVGIDAAVSQLLSMARASWSSGSADVAVYVAMAGCNTALSLIAGAIVGRVSLIALKKLTLL